MLCSSTLIFPVFCATDLYVRISPEYFILCPTLVKVGQRTLASYFVLYCLKPPICTYKSHTSYTVIKTLFPEGTSLVIILGKGLDPQESCCMQCLEKCRMIIFLLLAHSVRAILFFSLNACLKAKWYLPFNKEEFLIINMHTAL